MEGQTQGFWDEGQNFKQTPQIIPNKHLFICRCERENSPMRAHLTHSSFVRKSFILETPGQNPNVFNFTLHLHAQGRFIRAWKHRRVPDLHLISMDVYCTLQLWFQGRIGINLCTTTLGDRQSELQVSSKMQERGKIKNGKSEEKWNKKLEIMML